MGDRTTKIFLNASGINTAPCINKELESFLLYIKNGSVETEFVNKINQEVNRIREQKEWRRDYMSLYVHELNCILQGEEQGRIKGKIEIKISTICKLLEKNYTPESITDLLEIDLESTQAIYSIAKQQGHPYSVEKIYEVVIADEHLKEKLLAEI